jgi:uncharacterized membrane protein YedE/YeeE
MMQDIIYATIGGAMIGLAASLLLLFKGKIFGVSGVLGMSLSKPSSAHYWRYAVLLGLVLGSLVASLLMPSLFDYTPRASVTQSIIAGLLVGFGTRLGSGCTSGHGICGLPRLSVRSLVATLTFMVFGIITTYLVW